MNLKILNYKKIDWFSVVFPFIIIVYGLLIVINANFSAIDDYVFVDNLLKGKPLPIDSFVLPEVGRFFPLLGFEYNFVALFSTSPYFFFGFNSIQFFIVVYLIYYLLKDYIKDKKVIFFVILILIFLPSFVSSWHRLLLSERNVFFLLILFLIFFLKYQKDQKPLYIILSLIFANIALYYKEPVFLMLGSFAFFHLLFGWKELNPKQKLLDYLLIVSSFIFIVLYFFIVYINKGETPYGATEAQWILNFLKNSFRYSMYEPIIFFIILPAIILRIHEILILKEKKPDIFHDSLLFSTFFYLSIFLFYLKFFSHYYLLPIYAFGLLPILYYFKELYKKMLFKFLFSLTLLIILINGIPTTLHLLSLYKSMQVNFQNTIDFLVSYIKDNSGNEKRLSIFLYNTDFSSGAHNFTSYEKFLEFRGLNHHEFDLKANVGGFQLLKYIKENKNSPYTYAREFEPSTIESGDIVIITPFMQSFVSLDKREIKEMLKDYDLLFHADSIPEIPELNIVSLAKYYLYKKYEKELRDTKVMSNSNVFFYPIDFYVLRKK